MMDSNTGWSHSSVYTFGFGLLVLYNVLKQCHHSLSYSLGSLLSLKTGRSQRQKAEYMMASNMVAVTVIVPQQVFKAIHFLLLVFFHFFGNKIKAMARSKRSFTHKEARAETAPDANHETSLISAKNMTAVCHKHVEKHHQPPSPSRVHHLQHWPEEPKFGFQNSSECKLIYKHEICDITHVWHVKYMKQTCPYSIYSHINGKQHIFI